MPTRGEELLERIAKGIEKIAEDPIIEIESGPPLCPHCETINPEIKYNELQDEGPLVAFYLPAACNSCGKDFYGVPIEWAMFTTHEEAQQEIVQRAGVLNVNAE